ncbi:TolC family protein [Sphingobacterium sp.]|uniref:TolC family protein n=1 Tax=Sphingobacterium sp. TaxID=341027 RepID=UPI0031DB35DC
MDLKIKIIVAIALLFLMPNTALAQQITEREISVSELFELAKENHPTLAIYKSNITIAQQHIEIVKDDQLPDASAGLKAYYLGDATIIEKDFSSTSTIAMPHFGNSFALDARQLIWKGGLVKNNIKVQVLQEELAELNYQYNEQNIKLLVLGYYLDLSKFINQKNVYVQNIRLAEQRLQTIKKFYNQGMVTRNDLIRGELQLSNLNLSLQVLENNRQILNKQLTTALGLPQETQIIPDGTPTAETIQVLMLESYMEDLQNHPAIAIGNDSWSNPEMP